MADLFSGADPSIYASVILLVAGLVVAFFGKTLFKIVIFIIGAVAGGALAGLLASYVAPGNALCILGGVVIAAIIGGFLALTIVKGILAISVGGIFAWIAVSIAPDVFVALVAFLVGFVVALVFMDRLLGVITGIAGGAMAGFAVTGFMEGPAGQYGGLALGAVVAIAGIYYQNWKNKGDLSRPDKDEKK